MTDSLNVAVTPINAEFVALLKIGVKETVGLVVSLTTTFCVAALLALPAKSTAAPVSMSMVTSPSPLGATLNVACVALTLTKLLITPLITARSF